MRIIPIIDLSTLPWMLCWLLLTSAGQGWSTGNGQCWTVYVNVGLSFKSLQSQKVRGSQAFASPKLIKLRIRSNNYFEKAQTSLSVIGRLLPRFEKGESISLWRDTSGLI